MASPTTDSPALQSFILNSPYILPPAGETANFIDPPNRISDSIFIIALTTSVSSLFILIRLYVRLVIERRFRIEDYITLISFFFYVAESGFSLAIVFQGGVGVDLWNLPLKTFVRALYLANIAEILYGPAIFGIKIAILIQYQRIFVPKRTGNRTTSNIIRASIAVVVIFLILHTTLFLASCVPRDQIWDPFVTGGRCIDPIVLIQAGGVFNAIADIGLLLFPVRLLWKLQMHKRHKFRLSAVFAVGIFGLASSIARCYFSWVMAGSSNFTVNLYWVGMTGTLEITTGFIVASFPFVPRFYKELAAKSHELSQSLSRKSGTVEAVSTDHTYHKFHGISSQASRFSSGDRKDAYNLTERESEGNGQAVLIYSDLPRELQRVHLNSLSSNIGDTRILRTTSITIKSNVRS